MLCHLISTKWGDTCAPISCHLRASHWSLSHHPGLWLADTDILPPILISSLEWGWRDDRESVLIISLWQGDDIMRHKIKWAQGCNVTPDGLRSWDSSETLSHTKQNGNSQWEYEECRNCYLLIFHVSASRQCYNDKFSQTSDTDDQHRPGHPTPGVTPGQPIRSQELSTLANQRPASSWQLIIKNIIYVPLSNFWRNFYNVPTHALTHCMD